MVKPSRVVASAPRSRAPAAPGADEDHDAGRSDSDPAPAAQAPPGAGAAEQLAMLDVFIRRHSVRHFEARSPDPRQLREILEAADSAPSAGGLKARAILVVTDPQTKRRLVHAALGQEFIAEAPVVLVFWAVEARSAAKYGERGRELFAVQDATIAASFAWIQAVGSGLGACWVGAFDDDAVRAIFGKGIRGDWRPIALMPLGYPAAGA